MRLKPHEAAAIRNCVHRYDQNARIYLFGSRVDENARGGDIDLLILSPWLTYSDKLSIEQCLFETLGEQKIDITIADDTKRPFVRLALLKSIPL